MSRIAPYWKAVAGFVGPGAVALTYALQDGSVTRGEWLGALAACLIGSGIVYAAPRNKGGV